VYVYVDVYCTVEKLPKLLTWGIFRYKKQMSKAPSLDVF